ncbi:hypothetical protein KPSA1_02778 [Pseudomonas syringae pv. actinidiae]|uniref:Uncharacterized protein n=1 Tax=Pseudomonas syringae pv. actinidiae TaxID=103796 RepID=A0A2V0QVU4_PSESF|nr:hypothetical protein KPSA1_02778 [Pseudomonas syringae pv. actinidiae]GBH17017.1 hypothetical protein KPSA3_02975 [Pseudomonas syringae pv. actinidiae]
MTSHTPADFCNIVDRAKFVVDQHQRDQKRVIAQCGADRIGSDQAFTVRR